MKGSKPMRCAECHLAIPFYDEDITIHVVYSDGRPIRRLCHHVDFDETDPAIVAFLGSQDCAEKCLSKNQQAAESTNERVATN